LGTFQESKIEKGLVISTFYKKVKVEEIYLNKKLRKKVLNALFNLNECLEGSIPEITQDRKKCTICSWQKFCDKEAKENGFLTDIDGIGSKTASLLKANRITNTQTLASYSEKQLGEKLSKFNDQKYEKASTFVKQAQAYISGEPHRTSNKNDNDNDNDNDNLNKSNSKEKNTITVDLTNEEKIVFSQLGINPLIKLGKEYLTSNNFVRLKESNKETVKPLDNKKTKAKQIKKISKLGEDKIQIKIEEHANSKDKLTNKTYESNEVLVTDKKDEIELIDELNNSRKKRRRSSASIE